ncbi:hypothetical protein AB4516_10615 [Vibrio sp. 10N.222.54.F12]|uniref:hypothetical protein n=1 Tax=Vibrio TaxID=662 RepID=UPI000C828976|nr:hypothetical protein [Vibrio tasmaniensis]PML19332.1 hypothetical protein BCT83_00015 [Vibrio tasmaniensis]
MGQLQFDLYEEFSKLESEGRLPVHPRRWLNSLATKPMYQSLYKKLDIEPKSTVIWIDGKKSKIDCYSKKLSKIYALKRHSCIFTDESGVYRYRNSNFDWFPLEARVVDQMCLRDKTLDIETQTPVGNIDCENESTIYEVKRKSHWKSGLGQLLAYSVFRQSKSKVLVLFDSTQKINITHVENVCKEYDVKVVFID